MILPPQLTIRIISRMGIYGTTVVLVIKVYFELQWIIHTQDFLIYRLLHSGRGQMPQVEEVSLHFPDPHHYSIWVIVSIRNCTLTSVDATAVIFIIPLYSTCKETTRTAVTVSSNTILSIRLDKTKYSC